MDLFLLVLPRRGSALALGLLPSLPAQPGPQSPGFPPYLAVPAVPYLPGHAHCHPADARGHGGDKQVMGLNSQGHSNVKQAPRDTRGTLRWPVPHTVVVCVHLCCPSVLVIDLKVWDLHPQGDLSFS